MSAIDPITFAVVKSGMDAIVDEVAYTVIRTARSEIVKDVMDYSAAICDRPALWTQRKTMLGRDVVIDTTRRQVVIRDRLSRIEPARVLMEQLVAPRAEVYVELEFITSTRSRTQDLGATISGVYSTYGLIDQSIFKSKVPSTVSQLFTFGSGASLVGVTRARATPVSGARTKDSSTNRWAWPPPRPLPSAAISCRWRFGQNVPQTSMPGRSKRIRKMSRRVCAGPRPRHCSRSQSSAS